MPLAGLMTILVLSYLLKDSFLFRLAQSLLVGAAIGYGSAVILRTVLWGRLLVPLLSDSSNLWKDKWPLFFPLALGILLLTKLLPGGNAIGNLSLGYLFGVGAALAIGGALSGALVPQLSATAVSLSPKLDAGDWVNNALLAVGTLGTLLAFRFTVVTGVGPSRLFSSIANGWGKIGRGFMMVAFGAIFASVFTARVSVLVGQLYFVLHDWLGVVK